MTKTLLRAGSLACALMTSTCLTPSPTMAQSAPAYRNLDSNGVDLTLGDHVMSLVEGAIGSGPGELSLVREGLYYSGANAHQWDWIALYEWSGSRSVAVDQRRAETFTGTSAQQANGSTLISSGGYYIHQRADGTTTVFTKVDPNCTPTTTSSCRWLPRDHLSRWPHGLPELGSVAGL